MFTTVKQWKYSNVYIILYVIMLIIIIFGCMSSLLPFGLTIFRACIPNTQFRMNGRTCYCDALGRWSEANCEMSRRQTCKPGQIIWEDCSQCICQESGHFLCTNTVCGEEIGPRPALRNHPDLNNYWCMPFVSYYVNCSLCVCPASGKIKEARCARDASCPFKGAFDYQAAIKHNICIPKVMYLFSCLQCHCSDDGFFLASKCVETCRKPQIADTTRRCIPTTFYRRDCNICWCPDNSIANEALCTKTPCNENLKLITLNNLRNYTQRCHRHAFTAPKCYYCECSPHGVLNEKACLESDCVSNLKYDFTKSTCSPGEMVPICSECFCLRNGKIDLRYCTKVCSHQQKLMILEMVIKESNKNNRIVDKSAIRKPSANDVCEPNTIYFEHGKYCLCPENGNSNFKLCTTTVEENTESPKIADTVKPRVVVTLDFNKPCDPSTFVEFDCNTCYCSKSGNLDPKWCTYDDCEAKRLIVENHKTRSDKTDRATGRCIPGSISQVGCNFCICNQNGQLKDRACTKNTCAELDRPQTNQVDKFTCEPLSYYTVDCNTCFCPNSGIKNITKCTKNICEKNFLRSDVCVPGDLFSDECNICVCPPNGYKVDKVCTNFTCADDDAPWRKIFKLSQNLMGTSQAMEDASRSLELCFPGEEFEVGCKVCVCPDMGLRIYAVCTQMQCNDLKNNNKVSTVEVGPTYVNNNRSIRVKRDDISTKCFSFNITDIENRCTPGSMYILRCKQCICPYMGDINYFCRPLPKEFHCEQPYPGISYKKTYRKQRGGTTNETIEAVIEEKLNRTITVDVFHAHTKYSCEKPGRVTDDCFVCDCEENKVIIEEHCFKSNETKCEPVVRPTFLNESKLVVD